MVLALTIATFIATVIVIGSLVYAFTSGKSMVAQRLSGLTDAPKRVESDDFAEKQKERVQDALASVGKLIPTKSTPRTQLMMLRAGYGSANALSIFQGF